MPRYYIDVHCTLVDASSSYGSDREEELEELSHYRRKTIMGFVGYIQGTAQTMVDVPFDLEMYVASSDM